MVRIRQITLRIHATCRNMASKQSIIHCLHGALYVFIAPASAFIRWSVLMELAKIAISKDSSKRKKSGTLGLLALSFHGVSASHVHGNRDAMNVGMNDRPSVHHHIVMIFCNRSVSHRDGTNQSLFAHHLHALAEFCLPRGKSREQMTAVLCSKIGKTRINISRLGQPAQLQGKRTHGWSRKCLSCHKSGVIAFVCQKSVSMPATCHMTCMIGRHYSFSHCMLVLKISDNISGSTSGIYQIFHHGYRSTSSYMRESTSTFHEFAHCLIIRKSYKWS